MQSPASVGVDAFRSCKANLGSHAAQCAAQGVRAGANDLIDRVAAAIEAAPALDHPFREVDGAPGRRLQAANVLNATSPLHDAVTAALEAFEECESGTTACHSVGAAWDAGAAAVVDYLVQAAEREFDWCYTTLTEGWNAQAAAASGNVTAVAPIAPTDVAKMLDLAECLNVKVTLLADKMEDEGEGGKRKLLQLGPGGTESWLARLVASL